MIEPPRPAAHDSGVPTDLLDVHDPLLGGARRRRADPRRPRALRRPARGAGAAIRRRGAGRADRQRKIAGQRYEPTASGPAPTSITSPASTKPTPCSCSCRAGDGQRAIVFTHPNPGKSDATFFTDRSKGELWVGPRLGVAGTAERFGVEARPLDELPALPRRLASTTAPVRLLRGLDDALAATLAAASERDVAFAAALSEAAADQRRSRNRRVARRDRGDQARLRRRRARAADRRRPSASSKACSACARASKATTSATRTIAASGPDACMLHWVRNDRRIGADELLLLDAGVEARLAVHRRRDAHDPGQRHVHAGAARDLHAGVGSAARRRSRPASRATISSIPTRRRCACSRTASNGSASCASAEEALRDDKQFYKRYSLHNVSHMLGLDVHDCAQARAETYKFGTLAARHGAHGRARALLPARRLDRARALPRDRRADRGRRHDHGRRLREPLGGPARARPMRLRPGCATCAGPRPEPWVRPGGGVKNSARAANLAARRWLHVA